MKLTGSLGNVISSTPDHAQVTFESSNVPILERSWFEYATIYMYFRGAWVDRVRNSETLGTNYS